MKLKFESLEEAGYKRYPVNGYKNADSLFQKRIDDEIGKKYFIDILCYDFRKFAQANTDFSFEPQVQFREGCGDAVDVALLSNEEKSLEEVEEFFDKIWNTLNKPYNERWEGEIS